MVKIVLLINVLIDNDFYRMEHVKTVKNIMKLIQMIRLNVKSKSVVHVKELQEMPSVMIVLIIPELALMENRVIKMFAQ